MLSLGYGWKIGACLFLILLPQSGAYETATSLPELEVPPLRYKTLEKSRVLPREHEKNGFTIPVGSYLYHEKNQKPINFQVEKQSSVHE